MLSKPVSVEFREPDGTVTYVKADGTGTFVKSPAHAEIEGRFVRAILRRVPAGGTGRAFELEKVGNGRKQLGIQANRSQQTPNRIAS
jgi:hypothetical protein